VNVLRFMRALRPAPRRVRFGFMRDLGAAPRRMRFSRALGAGLATALLASTAAQAAELSTSDRLGDRREVAAGTRAYAIGFEDGRFYANGWHITGEMGGVWTPPLKLVDGAWFAVDGKWVGPATRFTSGWGYTRYRLPGIDGLRLRRTDLVPDGRRGALFGLTLTNPSGRARTARVSVDAHSELMTAYPWSSEGVTPNASDNLADTGAFDGRALVFRDRGSLPHPNAPRHDYAALVGSNRRPLAGRTGDGFWGAQSGHRCTGTETTAPMPSECDDGPVGKGTGGRLRYGLEVPGHGSRTLWVGVAGSDRGLGRARRELSRLLAAPGRALAAKRASRARLARWSKVSLPGDPGLARAVDWSKQNLADLTQSARDLKVRWTDQGTQFPEPSGTVRRATWFGAGYPDYPWLFGTDGEYTAFAGVALGQFETTKAHLRALRDVSRRLNPGSGVVVHEVVSDGSVWFGKDTRRVENGETKYDFNTDETVKFPAAVALVWRWTGDGAFMREMYSFARSNLRYAVERLDADGDGWPEGSGNVERTGMGEEKLDNAVYLIRGLYDFADMARATGQVADAAWARREAERRAARFEATWWLERFTHYADSLDDPGSTPLEHRHWIGVNPMEAELFGRGRYVPGLASFDHGARALAERESGCYSGTRPYNRGLFHTGCNGGADGKGDATIFSLGNAVQAVAEGNYGRLGPGRQKRYTDANVETMFGEPALPGEPTSANGEPDEQPGAMPEIVPSPNFDPEGTDDKNVLRCWTCRAMSMQAWGSYGTAWPVVHQQLGVRPDLGNGRLEVVPQVPLGQPSVRGRNIRLGGGALDARASHAGGRYVTRIATHGVRARVVRIGHILPRGTRPRAVRLDGVPVKGFEKRDTNRGTELTVRAGPGRHTLTITVAERG
jgi:hypothetical protein